MYGRDDTKIIVYSMRRCTKKGGGGEEIKRNFFDKIVNYCKIVEEQDNII